MERSALLVSRAAKPWQGRTLEGSGGSRAHFWTRFAWMGPVLRGTVVTFGLEGRETVAGHTLEALAVAARAFDIHLQDCMSDDSSPRAKT